MQLILEASADRHYKNLLTSNKVAIIIPDKYSNAGFRNIVFIKCYMPNKPPQYCRINLVHAAYMPLYYILLFPHGNTGWH